MNTVEFIKTNRNTILKRGLIIGSRLSCIGEILLESKKLTGDYEPVEETEESTEEE